SPTPAPDPPSPGMQAPRSAGASSLTRSKLLEVAAAFPVGDNAVEPRPLLAGRVDAVLVHVGSERLHRDLAPLELPDGIYQRLGHALQVVAGVGVPVVGRARIEAVLDAMAAAGDRRREREVRVHVRAWQPGLDPERPAAADDPEPARAVVPP